MSCPSGPSTERAGQGTLSIPRGAPLQPVCRNRPGTTEARPPSTCRPIRPRARRRTPKTPLRFPPASGPGHADTLGAPTARRSTSLGRRGTREGGEVLGGEPRHGHSSAQALVLDTCETIQDHQAHRQTPVQQPDQMSGAAQTGAAPAGLLAEALRCRGADNHEAN